jgi:hypothetical protein
MARRHRIPENEIHAVMRAVHHQLQDLPATDPDTEKLFMLLWRFHRHQTGPPAYPEITRETIDQLLHETEYLYTKEYR